MVRDRPDEAYELRDGSFETFRAVEAGRAAAREIEQKKAP
jgi:hypothetical protein